MSTLFQLPEEQEDDAQTDTNEVVATPLPVKTYGNATDTIGPTLHVRHEARSRLTDRMGHDSSDDALEQLSRGNNLREQVTMTAATVTTLSPWDQLTGTAARLVIGKGKHASTGSAITLLESMFDMQRDAPKFASRTKNRALSLPDAYAWLEKNDSEIMTKISEVSEKDLGEGIRVLGETLISLATAQSCGELVALAIMIKNYMSDSRQPKRETNKLLLEVYINMRDVETKIFMDTIIDRNGIDSKTLKEMVGSERLRDPWKAPGVARLNPTNTLCIHHWRNLWECMSRITLQKEIDVAMLETRMKLLPCTHVDHFTKRKKDQCLEEGIANFITIWDNADTDCDNADCKYLMPHKLLRLDSLVTAMCITTKMSNQVAHYLRHIARDGKGVMRNDTDESEIIDALYYAEKEMKPNAIQDLITMTNATAKAHNATHKKQGGAATTIVVAIGGTVGGITFTATSCWNCNEEPPPGELIHKSGDCMKTVPCLFCKKTGHKSRFCHSVNPSPAGAGKGKKAAKLQLDPKKTQGTPVIQVPPQSQPLQDDPEEDEESDDDDYETYDVSSSNNVTFAFPTMSLGQQMTRNSTGIGPCARCDLPTGNWCEGCEDFQDNPLCSKCEDTFLKCPDCTGPIEAFAPDAAISEKISELFPELSQDETEKLLEVHHATYEKLVAKRARGLELFESSTSDASLDALTARQMTDLEFITQDIQSAYLHTEVKVTPPSDEDEESDDEVPPCKDSVLRVQPCKDTVLFRHHFVFII